MTEPSIRESATREYAPGRSAAGEADANASSAARLLNVAVGLSDARTLPDVAEVLLDRALPAVDAVGGFVGFVEKEQLRILAGRGYPSGLHERLMALGMHEDAPFVRAIRTGESLWVEGRDPLGTGSGTGGGTHLSLPLVHGGSIVGGLGLTFPEWRPLGAGECASLRLLGQMAADAMCRARSFERERDLRQAAESAARAREETLGVVAHDLRNPLNLMGMASQFLAEQDLPALKRRELFTASSRALTQINRLIADLLDAAKAEAGRLAVEVTEIGLGSVLGQIEETFHLAAAEQGVTLSIEPLDLRIRADAHRLLQVLENLVANALKFVPRGGSVGLRVGVEGGWAIIRVSDTGPGIPVEDLSRLFDRFWQARPADRRGAGLGLAVAKGIVDAHGGRIWAESRPGGGSTFCFTLPLAASGVSTAA